VIERIDFVVIDKKTQGDISRSILLQVIAEQEHDGEPIMSRDFHLAGHPLLRRRHAQHGRQLPGADLKLFASETPGADRHRVRRARPGAQPA